jgi:hypothetical protein
VDNFEDFWLILFHVALENARKSALPVRHSFLKYTAQLALSESGIMPIWVTFALSTFYPPRKVNNLEKQFSLTHRHY